MRSAQKSPAKKFVMMSSHLVAKQCPLSIIELHNTPIYEQLRLEEALLRADRRNWCIINHGTPPAIVMGISGKEELLINKEELQKAPVPVIRRFSGGGTVFVDSDTLFVSWICNSADSGIKCCPHDIHQSIVSLYQQFFPALGIQLREHDYILGERKCGGNAQHLCKDRWLHHTSFLWDFREENMHYLQMPAKRPMYRADRSHAEFLCRLRDHFPETETWKSQLIMGIEDRFKTEKISFDSVAEILHLPHRRSLCYV